MSFFIEKLKQTLLFGPSRRFTQLIIVDKTPEKDEVYELDGKAAIYNLSDAEIAVEDSAEIARVTMTRFQKNSPNSTKKVTVEENDLTLHYPLSRT